VPIIITKVEKEYVVETQTQTFTITSTTTTCDNWYRHCAPHTFVLTETQLVPTTIWCAPGGCGPHAKRRPEKITKTVINYEIITLKSVCTKTETETILQRVAVPCHARGIQCPPNPVSRTITKYIPKTIPYQCVVTKTVRQHHKRGFDPDADFCTAMETSTRIRDVPNLCRRPPCGKKVITETITETVVRPCVKTKKVFVPTTVHKVRPVKCTFTEIESVTEVVTCRLKPCPPKTKTKYITATKIKPCIQKETDVVTKAIPVPVPKPFPVKCTVTEVNTVKEVVTCYPKPCPPKTKTKYITTTKVRPCIQKETETVIKKVPISFPVPVPKPFPVPVKCTVTEFETLRETVTCYPKPCKPKTKTRVVTTTKIQPCVVKETVAIPKPFPVKCTYTTTETAFVKYPVTCTKYPCPKTRTVVDLQTKTIVRPCIVRETETATKIRHIPVPVVEEKFVTKTQKVPVTRKVPVICSVTETLTKYRTVPKHCDKHPCAVETITDYVPVVKTKHCVVKETETDVVTKTKHHHHIHKETETELLTKTKHHHHLHELTETDTVTKTKHHHHIQKETDTAFVTQTKHHHHLHEITETAVATETQHHHHFHVATKTKLCRVTETKVSIYTTKKWRVKTAPPVTKTTTITRIKTKPCVVTETIPVPYGIPKPVAYTKSVPVPYPVPVPVEHKVPVPCREVPCPPPVCNERPCPPPPNGPCYEPPNCVPPSYKKFKRHDDDQSPTTPILAVRQCDERGVILHFDRNGILRDQLNRIGYIADNFQFQFDLPVQAGGYGEGDFSERIDSRDGAVYLTWRNNDVFYRCRSGNFYNLYSQAIGDHCEPTRIRMYHCTVNS
jgi:hypothetical protein